MNTLAITQLDGSQGTLAVSDIDEFAKRLRGRLVRRGDADYVGVRAVWNGMIEKQPALIARVQGVACSSALSARMVTSPPGGN